jgi:hypothetical protein
MRWTRPASADSLALPPSGHPLSGYCNRRQVVQRHPRVALRRLAVSGDAEHRDEVEYKVHLKMGGSYIYSWTATGVTDPEEFYTEFHGHTLAKGGTMTVAYYRKATGVSDNGVLTAPFDGVHGWYFQNQSLSPVKVRLRIAGFYELIPAGQPGNEAGFTARPTP